jgi:hypothetical protein
VRPRGEGENGLAAPYGAACRAASAAERRANGYGGSPWEFVCSITDFRGTHPYDVQVLPNWCYTASSQRHPGRFGIQACRA